MICNDTYENDKVFHNIEYFRYIDSFVDCWLLNVQGQNVQGREQIKKIQ